VEGLGSIELVSYVTFSYVMLLLTEPFLWAQTDGSLTFSP
jgi:hypothetical protein